MTYIRHSTLGLPTSPNPSPHRSQLDLGSAPPSSALLRPRGGRQLASFSTSRPSLSSAVQISSTLPRMGAGRPPSSSTAPWCTTAHGWQGATAATRPVAVAPRCHVPRAPGALLLHCLCPAPRPPGRCRIPPGHGEAPVLQGPHRPQLRGHLASCTGLLV
jgi:hypothetical protein